MEKNFLQQVRRVEKHNTRVIAIPEELLLSHVDSIKAIIDISDNNQRYEVVAYYEIKKREDWPMALFILATGKMVSSNKAWKKYPKSNTIYLFVCNEKTIS